MKVEQWIYVCSWCITTAWLGAQTQDTLQLSVPDSTVIHKENQMYQSIETYSKKRGFTKLLHKLIFRTKNHSSTSKSIETERNIDYTSFQNKIIRHINIMPLDPFGFDEKDTTVTPQKNIDKIGNLLHGKTKRFTIKAQLLFKENQPMDSLLLKETERLLRSRNYIRRVLIKPVAVASSPDSVDVQITVLDSWSILVDGQIAGSRGKLTARDRNIFGLGHEFSATYRQKFNENDNGYGFAYRAENLYGTYINANVMYDFGYNDNFDKQWTIHRTFFSPYTRWAGGIGFYQNRYNEVIQQTDRLYRPFLQTTSFDVYGGYAIPILKKRPEREKITNLILSARFKNLKYQEKPPFYLDYENYFTDQDLYISKIEFSRKKYIRDRYIFRHGDIEDIGTGTSVFISSGMLFQNNKQYPYLGVGFSRAAYTDKGYLGVTMQAGSLFTEDNTRQSVISSEGIYFSDLFSMGDWYLRQFFRLSITAGFNRNYQKDRLTLGGNDGIQGFQSDYVRGTRKLVLSSQTQTYSPFEWLGFRFSPFLAADIGFIGSEPKPFLQNDVYGKIGIGFYITNDYLAFNSVHLSFSYFPYIPGNGSHVLRMTGIRNSDFQLKNFEYQPPDIVPFQ
ncbi:MAG: hypothetical protein Q4G08_06680 [Capnocytophaga sp.]|nr:hypothetical protein [Capnocytophaga sp.]